MDLFREPLKTIEEEGSLSTISGATSSDIKFIDESVNSSRIDLRSITDEYLPSKSDLVVPDFNTCRTSVTDKGVETKFGVNQTLRSDEALSDVNVCDVQAPIRYVHFRWSVTSVWIHFKIELLDNYVNDVIMQCYITMWCVDCLETQLICIDLTLGHTEGLVQNYFNYLILYKELQ